MEKTIAIYSGTRSDYGLLSPIIRAINEHNDLDYQLIVTGSHLSSTFGNTISEIEDDGFDISAEFSLPEISTQTQINFCMSIIFSELNKILQLLQPDIFLVLGDRFETFAAAQVAFFQNIPLAHVHGGDITQGGAYDDSVRHAISKLAHIHFAACTDSAMRLKKLGEEEHRIHVSGAPGLDNCKQIAESVDENEILQKFGLDKNKPIILFTQHSITTEPDLASIQTKESLEALKELGYQTIITYPNFDPGGEKIIDLLTKYKTTANFQIHESLGYRNYLGIMKICSAIVGNSSSGIIESPYFKKPCINIGSRQAGRERSSNVIDVSYSKSEILSAINKALTDTEFINKNIINCISTYGDGNAGQFIAKTLANIPLDPNLLKKQITY